MVIQGCRFVPEKHFRKLSATDGSYESKYWFPGFGFDSGPNLQPCDSFVFSNTMAGDGTAGLSIEKADKNKTQATRSQCDGRELF